MDTAPLKLYGDSSNVVADIRFEYRAYNLAMDSPYDTVQLNVRALSMSGNEVNVPITFEAENTDVMEIDSNGVIRALATTSNALVRAYTSIDNVVRRDSVYVSIATAAPKILPKRVAIELNPGDSAKLGYSEQFARGKQLKVVREDSLGTNMSTLKVGVWSSDTSRAIVTYSGNTASVLPRLPGKVKFYVSSYAFGHGFLDSLEFLVAWPVSKTIVGRTRLPSGSSKAIIEFHPRRVTVGVGACVHWYNADYMMLLDIEFEDTVGVVSAAGNRNCYYALTEELFGGNISGFRGNREEFNNGILNSQYRGRTFTKPGLYKYRSRLHNTTGEVYVCDEKNDSTCSPENYRWEDGW